MRLLCRIPRRRGPGAVATALGIAGLSVALASGSFTEVTDLFRRAQYESAREALVALPAATGAPGEHRLWQMRLATDPDLATDLALQIVRDREVSLERRLQAALDGATVALARQRPEAAWQLLQIALEAAAPAVPGDVYLLAGQALRLAGQTQRAREMLASVRLEDPAFAAARGLLGRIGLESGDHELALSYFETAARRVDPAARPELLAGRWQALIMLGRDLEARDLAADILRDHPGTLAALEVQGQLRRESDELAAAADTLTAAGGAEPAEDGSGRYTIQLAAFRDRSLALQFVARWRREIPGLRIVPALDDLSQPLYRVQTGSFVSRVQAGNEATRLERALGLQGFVTESGA